MVMTLPSGIFTIYQEAVDMFINDFGHNCTLLYHPKKTQCVNCVYNPIGKVSANRYLAGGPMPFAAGGICPVCNGTGFNEVAQSDIVKLNIYWKPRDWIKAGIPIDIPDGMIQTRGFLADWPKLDRAIELQVHNDIANFRISRFTRQGELIPHGLGQDKYVLGFWRRIT